ncbi:MAG: hypothetical protein II951_08205 [Bacteroidales bacterium]|nr:hypothetical protein [Bacteroidales bacterium]
MKAMKGRRIVIAVVCVVLSTVLASCGTMTRKKKYRFGYCQVEMAVESRGAGSLSFC